MLDLAKYSVYILLPFFSFGCKIFFEDEFVEKKTALVRLKNGDVQVMNTVDSVSRWLAVCDNEWDDRDAAVVCRELGFPSGRAIHGSDFGGEARFAGVDFAKCRGTEQRLQDCVHLSMPGLCRGTTVSAGARCSGDPTEEPSCQCGVRNGKRIVGGQNTTKNEFPWQVLISSQGKRCGGTLISNKDVLTSAYCAANSTDFLVTVGEHDLSVEDGEHTVGVASSVIHPEYNPESHDNDFALLELKEPIVVSSVIMPVCLPNKYTDGGIYENKIATTTGWGLQQTLSQNFPNILQKVDMWTLSPDSCCSPPYFLSRCSSITQSMICATAPLRGTCFGDSGGPLVMEENDGTNTIIGITSFWSLSSCATPYSPSVFSRVTDQLEWIKTNIKGTVCGE